MKLPVLPARRPDWRARLAAYVAAQGGRAFRPGDLDCALFVAGAVEAMTGLDPAADLRGRYSSLKEGRALLQSEGLADHVALLRLLCPPVAPSLAQVGDLALLPSDLDAGALGVIQGPRVYVLRRAGLVTVSRLHIQEAFSI